jgi:hypothetical protein
MRLRPAVSFVLVVVAVAPAVARADLALSPAPGTPDANPQTQISVLGVAPSRIASVRAVGATSGAHAGKLDAYSGGRGASFVPASAFTAGETVAVSLRVRGRKPIAWSFTVAQPGTKTPPILTITATQPDKLQHFVTEPGLTPPQITVTKPNPTLPGSIFVTPLPSPVVHPESNNAVTISPVGPGGPMILDARGNVTWFHQLDPPDVAANLRLQHYRGKPVLTWWQGPVTAAAYGLGEGIIADRSYRTLKTVKAGNGYQMDLHEFALTKDGDALFPIYQLISIHVPGTPDGTQTTLMDAIVQEVDVATGLVVWEWHSLGHVPLSQSYATADNSAYYDAYHINSIQPVGRGRVFVSMRDTCAVYLIDRAGGRIVWRLGGKASAFRLGTGARFWFQHDAQLRGDEVSMFDDEAGPPQKAPSSRGLILRLDFKHRRAAVVRSLRRGEDTSAQSEGSNQLLAGGQRFLGFGAQPWFTQFSSAGKVVFDARLPIDDGSYRVYRFPWSGRPAIKPVAALSGGALYASWNGATAVARWQVLGGAAAGSLAPVAKAARTGFETRIAVPGEAVYEVRALDAKGHVLGTSAAVSP